MLTLNQEKLIKSLDTQKGRKESGLCLVEGEKNLAAAQNFLEFTFSYADTPNFERLVTTQTPQDKAGVARIPKFELAELENKKTILVLDGVQDPGNVGAIFRLASGFD